MNAAAGFDVLLEPLSLCFDAESARRLVASRIDPQVLARIEVLGEGANEGHLTADERSEYEALINAADFISILRLKAQRHLARAAN